MPCEKFLENVALMNVGEGLAERTRLTLLITARETLQNERDKLAQKMRELPEAIQGGTFSQTQFEIYKSTQQENLKRLEAQIENLNREAQALSVSGKIDLGPAFVTEFASYFKDIQHLATTLSDAPKPIKDLQTDLYLEVLSRLNKKDQEKQLGALTENNIKDMLEQAILTYNKAQNPVVKNNCRKIVQMGLFELIKRDCDAAKNNNDTDKNKVYATFLHELTHKIPPVEGSSIIDNFSDYKNSAGESVSSLLTDVEASLGIDTQNWADEHAVQTATQRGSLFQALRFGQEDRREYVRKRQEKLAGDLFWARDILDIERFTKSGESDVLFLALEEQRIIKTKLANDPAHQLSIPDAKDTQKHPSTAAGIKLKMAIQKVKDARKPTKTSEEIFPLGTLGEVGRIKAIDLMQQKLTEEMEKPVLEVDKNGEISATFFFYDKGKAINLSCDVQRKQLKLSTNENVIELVDSIARGHSSFGENAGPLAYRVSGEATNQLKNIASVNIRGSSLQDIETKLKQLTDSKERQCYLDALDKLKQEVDEKRVVDNRPVRTITDLKLNTHDELILRKLLELQLYDKNKPNAAYLVGLQAALKNIADGKYAEAIQTVGIDKLIEAAYEEIAKVPVDSVPEIIRPIVQLASAVHQSNEARNTATAELEKVFAPNLTEKQRVEKLVEIFTKEYEDSEIRATLNLDQSLIDQMNTSIHSMAEEVVRLYDRTSKGEPVLSEPEQNAYLSAIQQIAKKLEEQGVSITDVEFKIKHSLKGQPIITCIDAAGNKYGVQIDLGDISLPYSLVKAPNNNNIVFSFGGSRGVAAPFEGIEEKYGKKSRFFTQQRALGFGQQATATFVQNIQNGLNQVIKKGYTTKGSDTPAFTDKAGEDPRTRGMLARKDTLVEVEVTVLDALAKALAQEGGHETEESLKTLFWTMADSDRSQASLFTDGETPEQYKLFLDFAKGDTQADVANAELKKLNKGDPKYHNPMLRGPDPLLEFKERLALSQAIMDAMKRLQDLGFAHNDIKPENFLYKRNPDGSYAVKFIDWATGGFERPYKGDETDLVKIFKNIFGKKYQPEEQLRTDGSSYFEDKNGRFVQKIGNTITYGVNPKLQILHGSRHSTLPYISPTVLVGEGGKKLESELSSEPRPELDTTFETPNSSVMDDWALTAMIFGICNRDAYFELVKGRIVADYFVPEVLGPGGENNPAGLKIINPDKFREFFACDNEQNPADNSAVMFIPSNKREGEPLHLYRRLQGLSKICREAPISKEKTSIADDIDKILLAVHNAVAKGNGLSKESLQALLLAAETCFTKYEKLSNKKYQEAVQKTEQLAAVIAASKGATADELLGHLKPDQPSRLEILCTYPDSAETRQAASEIVKTAFSSPGQFADKFLLRGRDVPQLPGHAKEPTCRNLLKACIGAGQTEVLLALLANVPAGNSAFVDLVSEQGLLHYALEQNNTVAATALLTALEKAQASPEQCFDLMLERYTQPHIKWNSNAFHIAIRNNNPDQLALILERLPAAPNNDAEINQALLTCAVFHNPDLFEKICTAYDNKNPGKPITLERILHDMKSDIDQSTPYHHFISDAKTTNAIPWETLEKDSELAREFLLKAPSPLLIAAKNNNIAGITALIELGTGCGLEPEEWKALFTQTDTEGKNGLNHLLERKQFDAMTSLLGEIRAKCPTYAEEVLSELLSNSDPVNPLRNFLESTKDKALQFKVMNQLLDTLSKNVFDFEHQQTRVTALLVNREWLNQRAADSPDELKALLQNDRLSTPFKQYLFEQLVESSRDNPGAQEFYTGLLAEVVVTEAERTPVTKIAPDILLDVAKQRGDFASVVRAFEEVKQRLGAENQRLLEQVSLLETQRVADRARISDLEKQPAPKTVANAELEEANKHLRDDNRELQSRLASLSPELDSAQARLALLEERVRQAEQQAANKAAEAETEKMRQIQILHTYADEVGILITNVQKYLGPTTESEIAAADRLTETKKLMAQLESKLTDWERAEQSPLIAADIGSLQDQRRQLTTQRNNLHTVLETQLARQQFLKVAQARLEIINEKAQELELDEPGSEKAVAARELHTDLNKAMCKYVIGGTIENLRTDCNLAIQTAKPKLEKHRGFWGGGCRFFHKNIIYRFNRLCQEDGCV